MTGDISFVNGKAEAFTALTPAWWDGKREYMTDQHLTSDEIWGERGLLNFKYVKRPVYDEWGTTVPGFFRTVREDTGRTIGCGVTDRYQLIQPREALGWMDSLMQDGIMKYASAGVLKDGRDIWILGVIPDAEETPIPGEKHDKFVLWTDRFDGGGTLKWKPCITRVECANTLVMALGEQGQCLNIRHTGNLTNKLSAARQAIIAAKSAFKRYNADMLHLLETRYTKESCREFIATLFPIPLDPVTKQEAEKGRARTHWERKVQEVRKAFAHPANNLEHMKGTWFQLFNAVTMAVDHGDIFRTRSDDLQAKADNRFLNLMTGPGADLKAHAYDAALLLSV